MIDEAIRNETGSGGFIKDGDGFRMYSFHLDSSSELKRIVMAVSPQRPWINEADGYDD